MASKGFIDFAEIKHVGDQCRLAGVLLDELWQDAHGRTGGGVVAAVRALHLDAIASHLGLDRKHSTNRTFALFGHLVALR